jgi:hypothetical protein
MDNAIIWLIRLLTAHLLTDFVLQPSSWVAARKEKHLKAKEFWYHISITTIIAAWLTCFDTWWLPVVIFLTHGVIDWWKSYRSDEGPYFFIDQALHVLVILGIWWFKFPETFSPLEWVNTCLVHPQFWVITIAVVFITKPVGIVIGLLTGSFRKEINDHPEQSLSNAGKWIGILERLIIFFLVLVGQYEAIGLLIAAKSIIRLKDGEQKMSEYVLVGTLISVSVAILTGYIVSKSL